MAKFRYTKKHTTFLRKKYPAMKIPELTIAFNKKFRLTKTEGQIRAAVHNHKITCGRPLGNPVGTLIAYTQEQAEFIRKGYIEMPLSDLVAVFNTRFPENQKTLSQLKAFTNNHKIKSGRTGRFEKGHKSWNAGTKGLVKPNSGNFKKGHVPANANPLGHERIDNKDGYVHIKVAEENPYTGAQTRYRQKHVVVWERENGKVPPGMAVALRDGDKLNCEIDNLMLVSRAELLHLNLHNYKDAPDELKPSILALVKLEVAAGCRYKTRKEERK